MDRFSESVSEETGRALVRTVSLLYVIVMALVSVCAAFIQVAQMEDEYRMKDGYLRITESVAYGTPNEVYYAESVYGIARQKFTWDTEHYAQSLSRIYGYGVCAGDG